MTGSRELTALQQFRGLSGSSAGEIQTNALVSIAISLAALADLWEYELSCMVDADGEPDGDEGDEVRPS